MTIAHGETATAADASACRSGPAVTGRVAHVIDGRSFVLEDGREVRIAGIEVPPFGPGDASSAAGAAAKDALEFDFGRPDGGAAHTGPRA